MLENSYLGEKKKATVSFYGTSSPLPKQLDFFRYSGKIKCYLGGFGSGKTFAGCQEAFYKSMQWPGNTGVIARTTYGALEDTTKKVFFEVLADMHLAATGEPGDPLDPLSCCFVYSYNKTHNSIWLRSSHNVPPSLVLFRSLDTPEKFKSLELGWFYIDEASESSEEAFLMLSGRLRGKAAPPSRLQGFMTTNPCSTRHWIYKKFVKEKVPGYGLFRAPTTANIHLPDGYEAGLRAQYPADWVDRYVEGNFGMISEGQPVYTDFSQLNHVREIQFNATFPIHRSWDFGYHHPSCLISQIVTIDGRLHLNILKEVVREDMLITDFADDVLKVCKTSFPADASYVDYCDPAGNQVSDKSERTSVDILKSKQVYPHSSFQHIKDGVLLVRMMLSKNTITVHPGCVMLVEGFIGGYHYPKKFDGTGKDPQPEKDGVYDHLQDCLRYMMRNTIFWAWLKRPQEKKPIRNTFKHWQKLANKQKKGSRI